MIQIKTIPHNKQRYETVGDWYYDKRGNLQIRVSAMNNRRYEFLIILHELVEAFLCQEAGISDLKVTEFDMEFEKLKEANPGTWVNKAMQSLEPGENLDAPYYKQHQIATKVERVAAGLLNVRWPEYEEAVDKLSQDSKKATSILH